MMHTLAFEQFLLQPSYHTISRMSWKHRTEQQRRKHFSESLYSATMSVPNSHQCWLHLCKREIHPDGTRCEITGNWNCVQVPYDALCVTQWDTYVMLLLFISPIVMDVTYTIVIIICNHDYNRANNNVSASSSSSSRALNCQPHSFHIKHNYEGE